MLPPGVLALCAAAAPAPPALPALWPRELPLPPDAQRNMVLDNTLKPAGQQGIVVNFHTAWSRQAVLDLYRTFFRARGKVTLDMEAQGVPTVGGKLDGYDCMVVLLGEAVQVAVKPDGGTFTAFHEQDPARLPAPAPMVAEPLDTRGWRLAGSFCPGDQQPGVLLYRQRDGGLWAFGLALVRPKGAPDAHGKVYCDQDPAQSHAPVRVFGDARLAVAAPGAPLGAVFVVDGQGTLHSFGSDCGGRLGQGVRDATLRYFAPRPVLEHVREVAAESANAAAVTEDGALYLWGSNLSGQIPGTAETFVSSPLKVMDGVVSVALARDAGYAVKRDGTLWGWGEAFSNGFLDGGVLKTRRRPYRIMDGVRAVFASGLGPVMALKADGGLWSWGANDRGQCGAGRKELVSGPARIAEHVARVAFTTHHCALLKTDGTVWTWGGNWTSQCGFDRAERAILRPRLLAEGAADIAVTGGETYVLRKDGRLLGCGHNTDKVALQGGTRIQVGLADTGIRLE